MRLVACPSCHSQFDVSDFPQTRFGCRCGSVIEIRSITAVDVPVARCSACGGQMNPGASACTYCRAEVVIDIGRLSLLCPECYARNSEGSKYCRGCGVAFAPLPLEEHGIDLHCPVCVRVTMNRRRLAGFLVDECGACHGLWVLRNDFTALITATLERVAQEVPQLESVQSQQVPKPKQMAAVQYRKCPSCNTVMNRRNYQRVSGIVIDECVNHGVFLDADELEGIVAFLRTGGMARKDAWEKREADYQRSISARTPQAQLGKGLGGGTQWSQTTVSSGSVSAGLAGEALVGMLDALFSSFFD